MDAVERQLLEYLAGCDGGYGLVCMPNLVHALKCICHREPRLVSDVYEGTDGCMLAAITKHGRSILADAT